jgi:hypothetical protein
MLDSSSSVWSVSYQRRMCRSVYVSPLSLLGNCLVNTFPLQRIHNSRGTFGLIVICMVRLISKENVGLYMYPPIDARQLLGKHVPVATKNCRRRRFLCCPCRIKGNWVISCPQNFLYLRMCNFCVGITCCSCF